MHLRNLCHGVKSKQRLPFAITIILKINENLTIDSVVCRKSFGFFSTGRYSSPLIDDYNKLAHLVTYLFVSRLSVVHFFSIQSKTLMFDAVSRSNSPF